MLTTMTYPVLAKLVQYVIKLMASDWSSAVRLVNINSNKISVACLDLVNHFIADDSPNIGY